MCYCSNLNSRVPWCDSDECQVQLKLYLKDGDTPADERLFKKIYDELKSDFTKAKVALERHVSECTHPKRYVKRVAGANTGNWCEQDDCYWDTCDCSLCGKHWTEYK